jgi:predicted peptidase
MKTKLSLWFTVVAVVLCVMKSTAQTTTNSLVSAALNWKTEKTGTLQYLQYLPPEYNSAPAKKWPLMLFLHGAGERGTDVNRVAIHGPLSHVRQGTNYPFIIIAPQCPAGQIWENEPLLQLLDASIAQLNVDTNRIYLTGLSMGGYGSWKLGLTHPTRFAALAPVCGGANMIEVMLGSLDNRNAILKLPIWAFHGAKDEVVPLIESERVVDSLKRAGHKDVQLTVYPEVRHDSWKPAYSDPKFYEWMLTQSR